MRRQSNVTMIDDLPFLDDLDQNQIPQQPISQPEMHNIQKKFIRNKYNTPNEAGMNPDFNYQQNQQNQHHHIHHSHPQQQQLPNFNNIEADFIDNAQNIEMQFHHQQQHQFVNCISVAEHTQSCLVCSRLYTNDRTIYIIAIIMLLIICILLIKRVLES